MKYFEIDDYIFNNPNIFHWILCNNHHKRTLKINLHSSILNTSITPKILSIESQIGVNALKNIKNIIIYGQCCKQTEILFNNIHRSIQKLNLNKNYFNLNKLEMTLESCFAKCHHTRYYIVIYIYNLIYYVMIGWSLLNEKNTNNYLASSQIIQ